MNRPFRSTCIALASVVLSAAITVQAQSFPSKPVRIIVPYGAGGSTDVISRILAQKLGERLGQTVVVENKAGANAIIGTDLVAKAEPDGHTLLASSNGNAVNVSLYKDLPHDFRKDLVPVAGVASMPNVIAVHPSQPMRSLAEVIRAAKEKPDSLAYAHAGVGSSQHLSGEMLKLRSGAQIRAVAYKGGGPATKDAVGGHVPMIVAGLPAILQQVKGGQMRAVAVTSSKRSPQLPDVPTVEESGYKPFNQFFWIALVAPSGTPKAVIDRLNREVNAVLAMPEMAAKIAEQGAEPMPGSVEDLAKFISSEIETAAGIIRDAGIKAGG